MLALDACVCFSLTLAFAAEIKARREQLLGKCCLVRERGSSLTPSQSLSLSLRRVEDARQEEEEEEGEIGAVKRSASEAGWTILAGDGDGDA